VPSWSNRLFLVVQMAADESHKGVFEGRRTVAATLLAGTFEGELHAP